MSEQILAALARYGLPALFAVVTIASVGVPLPVTLLMIVAGSLAAQNILNLWITIAVATVGSSAGDQLGYAIGRFGGKTLAAKLARIINKSSAAADLETRAGKLEGLSIFLTRWLFTTLGPWVNFASGMANFSWFRFTVWDFAGELLGAALYIGLGYIFSDRVQAIAEFLGNLTWALLGLLLAGFLGWKLFKRQPAAAPAR